MTRPRKPAWAIALIVCGALVLLASGTGYALLMYGLGQVNSAVKQANLLNGAAATLPGHDLNGPLNLLLVGLDTRPSENTGTNTDTIIVVHIPASHDRAYLMSIPRDTYVQIPPDPGAHFLGGMDKINAAYEYGGGENGGVQLLADTLHQEYGLTFDAAAVVNFNGFQSIVEKLGGLDIYVDEVTHSIRLGVNKTTGKQGAPFNLRTDGTVICPGNASFDVDPEDCLIPGMQDIVYQVGMQHLNPGEALDYVRSRDGLTGTDYARQRHQVEFIQAIVKEAYQQGLSDPFKLTGFIQSIGQAVTFDGNGNSIDDWIFTLKGIQPSALISIKTNNGQFDPTPCTIGGLNLDCEQLSTDSLQMLRDAATDRTGADLLGLFLTRHAGWIVTGNKPAT
jgi:LCP family protein required for cell wall assembly